MIQTPLTTIPQIINKHIELFKDFFEKWNCRLKIMELQSKPHIIIKLMTLFQKSSKK
jgi:hypothetical protein